MGIKDFINDIKLDSLDKSKLFKMIENVNYVDAQLPYMVNGLTVWDKILFDSKQMHWLSEEKKLFVILHELCHHLRLQKILKRDYFKIFATDDFELLADTIITEEIIADRYACFTFYLLTGNTFDKRFTQNLELSENKSRYKKMIDEYMFNKFNSEEEYFEYVDSIHTER